jgi:hypothetical protein
MEGVAFAARRNLGLMKAAGHSIDLLVASGGGAKPALVGDQGQHLWMPDLSLSLLRILY